MKTGKIFLAAAGALALCAATLPGAASSSTPTGDMVIGLSLMGVQKAYPASFFEGTPVVNDRIGHLDIVIFYNLKDDYASAFFRIIGGEPLEFSGRARGMEADDLTTATRWDMTTGEAVGGNLMGMKLIPIPVSKTPLSEWREIYPSSAFYEEGP